MATYISRPNQDSVINLKATHSVYGETTHYTTIDDILLYPTIPTLARGTIFQDEVTAAFDIFYFEDIEKGDNVVITAVTFYAYCDAFTARTWSIDVEIDGSWIGALQLTGATTWEWYRVTFSGLTWTKAQWNSARIKVTASAAGGGSEKVKLLRMSILYASLTYTVDETYNEPYDEPSEPPVDPMNRIVSDGYKVYARANLRRPTVRAYVYYGAGGASELDITPYLTSIEVSTSMEHEASEGHLSVLDNDGMFDPLAGGAYATVFAANNVVRVYMGYSDEVYKIMTGRVAQGGINYSPANPTMLEIPIFDYGKNYWDLRITSDVYLSQNVNTILSNVFVDKGFLSAADFAFAEQTYNVQQIQFIDETLMDIAYMLMMPNNCRAYFNYDGKLVTRGANAPSTSSWDYGSEVQVSDFLYDDPSYNRVVVSGRNMEPTKSLGPEIKFFDIDVDIIKPSGGIFRINWKYDTQGNVYDECRIEKDVADTHGTAFWSNISGPYYTTQGVYWRFPGSRITRLQANFYGKLVSWYLPRAMGTAKDDALIAVYGEKTFEVDNPVVQTSARAATIAANILDRIKKYANRIQIIVVQNLMHEPGDHISFQHPKTGAAIHGQVTRVTHRVDIGGDAITILDLLKLDTT